MRRVAVSVFFWAAGCSQPGTPRSDAGPVADAPVDRLTLGTTTVDGQEFLPLGADQVLVAGVQGGFHVWLKLRVAGLRPGPATLHRTVHRAADGAPVLDAESIIQVGAATGGTWELPSPLPLFMCPTPTHVGVVDQAVRVDVMLTSAAEPGEHDEATATFTVHCPDAARAVCIQLCSG